MDEKTLSAASSMARAGVVAVVVAVDRKCGRAAEKESRP